MLLTRELMRLLIIVCLVGMALLAVFYLRTRRMTLVAYISWGLLALLVPLLGPFLVILSQPGERIPRLRKNKTRRRGSWVLL
jgi:hypothetical protein